MSKIKDGYKLELQMPETIKLFESSNNLIDKTKIINIEKSLKYYIPLHPISLMLVC